MLNVSIYFTPTFRSVQLRTLQLVGCTCGFVKLAYGLFPAAMDYALCAADRATTNWSGSTTPLIYRGSSVRPTRLVSPATQSNLRIL